MNLDRLSRAIRPLLADDPRVSFVLVYGSVARGTDRPGSDLDLAVGLVDRRPADPLGIRLELAGRMSGLAERVELVLAAEAPPALAFRIARDGVAVFQRDPRAVTNFRARAFSEYPDWVRFIAPHEEAMRRRLREDSYGRS